MNIASLRLAIASSTVTCTFLIFSFASPYWLESRSRAVSPFVRIGLWEACFDGFVHPSDAMNKAYTGCMWIFSKEFFWIRFWLLPGWFVATQIFAILALVGGLSSFLIQLWMFLKPYHEIHRNWNVSAFSLMLISGVLQFTAILIFGIASKADWDWMINPVYNYLSWSYGFAIMASVFAFATTYILRRFWVKCQLQNVYIHEYTQQPQQPPMYPGHMVQPIPAVKTL